MVDIVEQGVLHNGDIVIADNSSIHFARDIADVLSWLLDSVGARLVFLPTYSPELNPCELIFGQMKQYLRLHRAPVPFRVDLALAAAQVSGVNVYNYYVHCIDHFDAD